MQERDRHTPCNQKDTARPVNGTRAAQATPSVKHALRERRSIVTRRSSGRRSLVLDWLWARGNGVEHRIGMREYSCKMAALGTAPITYCASGDSATSFTGPGPSRFAPGRASHDVRWRTRTSCIALCNLTQCVTFVRIAPYRENSVMQLSRLEGLDKNAGKSICF